MPGRVKLLMHGHYIWVVTIFTTYNRSLQVEVQGPDHYAPSLIHSYLLPMFYIFEMACSNCNWIIINPGLFYYDIPQFLEANSGTNRTFIISFPHPFLTDITFKRLELGFLSRRQWPEIPAWRLANLIEVFFRFSHSLQANVKILP
jgi:hypothetical protein